MDDSLQKLLDRRIYVGTSSWKYPGWSGIVYRKKYQNEKDFTENCLTEYAEHYGLVGIDHTYYDWPSNAVIRKYASQTPPSFRFGLKVTERITVLKFPKHRRYGQLAGSQNPFFLDVGTFCESFLAPIAEFKERVGVILFEFSQFFPGTLTSGREFVKRLDKFFSTLLKQAQYPFAVEIRNHNWLREEYFRVLFKHQLSHVFNSWTRMPSIGEQLDLSPDRPFPSYVARLLLRPGTKYEKAVEAFSPYDRVHDEQPGLREDAARLIRKATQIGAPAYVFVNNRAEGCAPVTIQGILASLDT